MILFVWVAYTVPTYILPILLNFINSDVGVDPEALLLWFFYYSQSFYCSNRFPGMGRTKLCWILEKLDAASFGEKCIGDSVTR